MATRSSISMRNPDGSYTSIYCHWDGYPDYNGAILYHHYRDESRIRQLMELGALSSLGPDLGEKHETRNPHPHGSFEWEMWENEDLKRCTARGRDADDHTCPARTFGTRAALMESMEEDYNYLWEDGRWLVKAWGPNTRFTDLGRKLGPRHHAETTD
jgi:hypothetical protein